MIQKRKGEHLIGTTEFYASSECPLHLTPALFHEYIPKQLKFLKDIWFYLPRYINIRPIGGDTYVHDKRIKVIETNLGFGLMNRNLEPSRKKVQYLWEWKESKGLYLTAHAPTPESMAREQYVTVNLAASGEEEQAKLIKALQSAVDIAEELHTTASQNSEEGPSPTLICHTVEIDTTKPRDGSIHDEIEKIKKQIIENLKKIAPYLKDKRAYLLLENIYNYGPLMCPDSDPEFLCDIIEAVDCDYIRICFDTEHANIMARYLYEKGEYSLEDIQNFRYHRHFIQTLGPYTHYLHLGYNSAHSTEYKFPQLYQDLNQSPQLLFKPSFQELMNIDQHDSLTKFTQDEWQKFSTTTIEALLTAKAPVSVFLLEVAPLAIFWGLKKLSSQGYGVIKENFFQSVDMLQKTLEQKK